MSKLFKYLVIVFVFVGFVAGCGQETYKGKTAKEGGEESERKQELKDSGPLTRTIDEVKMAQQEKEKKGKADALARENATSAYVGQTHERLIAVRESKDGKILIDVAGLALNREVSGGNDLVLLGGMWGIDSAVMKALLPKKGDTSDEARMIESEAVNAAERSMRAEVFGWFARDSKRLDAFWASVRPLVRLQYGLLTTLRGHEQLFKTTYTGAGFESLRECLIWHEELTYQRREGVSSQDHPEAKRCDTIFKKFGVKAQFGLIESQLDEYAARNALYIVRFLARRSANGGEKFAQQFQRIALDYIKR